MTPRTIKNIITMSEWKQKTLYLRSLHFIRQSLTVSCHKLKCVLLLLNIRYQISDLNYRLTVQNPGWLVSQKDLIASQALVPKPHVAIIPPRLIHS